MTTKASQDGSFFITASTSSLLFYFLNPDGTYSYNWTLTLSHSAYEIALSLDNQYLVVAGQSQWLRVFTRTPTGAYVLSQSLQTNSTWCEDAMIDENNSLILVGGGNTGIHTYTFNSNTSLFEHFANYPFNNSSSVGSSISNGIMVFCLSWAIGTVALF